MKTSIAPTLTAADRCDRCVAQAYVRVVLKSGKELLFCGHHGRDNAPKLEGKTIRVFDEFGKLK